MKKILFSAIICALSLANFGQTYPNGMPVHRNCGTIPPDAAWEAMFQQQIQNFIANQQTAKSSNGSNSTMATSYTIPVVVHVIHGGQAIGTYPNITNAQAVSQINILTNDFAGVGQYTSHYPSNAFQAYGTAAALPAASFNGTKILIGNAQITFLPCYYDKNGNAMPEPGIDRIDYNSLPITITGTTTSKNPAAYTNSTSFMNFITSQIKPNTIWNISKYMNIWTTDENAAVGLLGFATFPGGTGLAGLSAPFGSSTTDGLWCWAKAYGTGGAALAPYNLGRTATHEIGHWLGLRHIWGDGSCLTDYCLDTPPHQTSNFVNQNTIATPTSAANANTATYPYLPNNCTAPTGASNTIPTGSSGCMFMNFMDYSDDNAMYMFTNDQVNRIQTVMTTTRSTLGTHGLTVAYPTASFSTSILSPCTNQTVQVTDLSTGTVSAPSSWNYTITGATTPTTNVQNPVVTFTATGTQTITLICAANGTQVSLPVTQTVSVGTGITMSVSSSATGTVCGGTSVTLTASGATTYTWNTGSNATSIVVSPTATTIYTVTGSSGACSATKTSTVNIGAGITVNVAATSTNLCSGQSSTLTASGATTYTWNTGSNATSIVVSPTTSTNYTLTGTTGGCSGTNITAITVNTTPAVSVNSSTICTGASANLTAAGATTYSWSTGSSSSTVSVNPISTTVYTVIGYNGSCSNAKTSTVTVNGLPTIIITPASAGICSGSAANFAGSGAVTYTWSSGQTTSTVSLLPASTAIYTLSGTNAAGCVGSNTAAVTVTTTPTVSVSSYTICAGGSVTIPASGATSYSWNTGATSSSITVSPGATTVYSVTGFNGSCSNLKTTTVTIGSSVSVIASASSPSVCPGNSTTLTASGATTYTWNTGSTLSSIVVSPSVAANYSVAGTSGSCNGSGTVSVFVYSNPSTIISSTNISCFGGNNGALSPSSSGSGPFTYTYSPSGPNNIIAGTYTTVTQDSHGCKTNNITTITQPTALNGVASATNVLCFGAATGLASVNATGGTAGYSYTWSPSGGNSSTASGLSAGPYVVTIKDANNCTTTASTSVGQPASALSAGVSANNTSCSSSCNGSASVTASGGTPAYSYTVLPSGGNLSTANNLCAGTYSYLVKDANNCTATSVFTISPGTGVLTVNVTYTNASCGGCNDGIASATGIGAGPFTYMWMPGMQTSQIATGLGAGCYSVTVTNGSGCSGTNTVCVGFANSISNNNSNSVGNVKIIPNPNNGEFLVECSDNSQKQIEIIDVTGRIIMTKQTSLISTSININEFASGVYLIKIISDKKVTITRMIKN